MSCFTETARRPRIAELDPFDVKLSGESVPGSGGAPAGGADVSYGCVDWYVYGGERTAPARTRAGGVHRPARRAHAATRRALQPRTATLTGAP